MRQFIFLFFLPLLLFFTYRFFSMADKISEIHALEKKLQQPVYTAFAAQQLLITGEKTEVLPLTGPAFSWTVFCRENHDFLSYKTDRYGFHNPDSIWNAPQWEAVFLGDSFVQGACVPSEKNFVRLFEKHHGPSGNLGSYGNGPLTQLASLIEYAANYKPKKVFWIYMQNDLYLDLNLEVENNILKNYLLGKTQNLTDQQTQINTFLKAYLKTQQAAEEKRTWKSFLKAQISDLRSSPQPHPQSDLFHLSEIDWPLYANIIHKAATLTRSWGGEFYFIIMPSADMLMKENAVQAAQLKKHILRVTQHSGSHVIDLHEKFQVLSDPLNYYELLPGRYGHFTTQGYLKVEESISHSLLIQRDER